MLLALLSIAIAEDLSAADRERLEAGEVVWSHRRHDGWVYGRAAMLVAASSEQLWQGISDYSAYVDFIPYVTESQTIQQSKHAEAVRILSRYELTTRGIRTQYGLTSQLSVSRGQMIFYYTDGPGDIEDGGNGLWQVTAWNDDRQLLSLTISLPRQWWIPQSIETQVAEHGLTRLLSVMGQHAATLNDIPSDPDLK